MFLNDHLFLFQAYSVPILIAFFRFSELIDQKARKCGVRKDESKWNQAKECDEAIGIVQWIEWRANKRETEEGGVEREWGREKEKEKERRKKEKKVHKENA